MRDKKIMRDKKKKRVLGWWGHAGVNEELSRKLDGSLLDGSLEDEDMTLKDLVDKIFSSDEITEEPDIMNSEDISFSVDVIQEELQKLHKFIKSGRVALNKKGYIENGVYQKGHEVRIVFESSKDLIVGKSKCNPRDIYCDEVGISVALDRVLRKVLGEFYDLEV